MRPRRPVPSVPGAGERRGPDDSSGFWKVLVATGAPACRPGGTAPVPLAVELVIALEGSGTPTIVPGHDHPVRYHSWNDAAGPTRHTLLGAVCAGGAAAAFAAATVTARPSGASWVLSGAAAPVVDGDRADELAVVAAVDGGIGLFFLPSASVAATRSTIFDGSFHLAEVDLDGIEVPAERAVVGPDVVDGVVRATDEAVMGMAATMSGASPGACWSWASPARRHNSHRLWSSPVLAPDSALLGAGSGSPVRGPAPVVCRRLGVAQLDDAPTAGAAPGPGGWPGAARRARW